MWRERSVVTFGVLPCHTEQFSADVVADLPAGMKIIANFSVGVDHCDLAACEDRGIVVTNTPDVLNDDVADLYNRVPVGAKVIVLGLESDRAVLLAALEQGQ